MGINKKKKKGKKNVLKKKKKNYTNGVCEKYIIDGASNHIDTTMIESCRDYLGKNDSFQEQHT